MKPDIPFASRWPVLTRYGQDRLRRIALPLGGIGTGTVSLGGRGDLRDWELANRPAKGFTPVPSGSAPGSFFALWTRDSSRRVTTRLLEGAIDPADYEGGFGCPVAHHNLPHFRRCTFAAAYPLGQVSLSDPDVPLAVRIEAFNPLIPADAEASGIPMAMLRFVLRNPTARALETAVCGTLLNFIGSDGTDNGVKDNYNRFRKAGGLRGIFLQSKGVDSQAASWGTLALSTTATAGLSWRTDWANRSWGDSLLEFWDDFADDGRIHECRNPAGSLPANYMPKGSLCVRTTVPARAEQTVTFLLTWHFPNRQTWTPKEGGCNRVGNYYTTRYRDAWDVAARTVGRLGALESGTLEFVSAFCAGDLPLEVKEAALYNVSTLRSQSAFRVESGHLLGWEGCADKGGCCHGSCTHVWNYEQATAFLFGGLAATMREVEFRHATDASGLMSFRANLPLEQAREWKHAAADGQLGCLMKLYRDWQLSGDEKLLRRLWPRARKALEFCWIAGGWDADRDGVMEGCQHNTMDVEYYGPNPQMGIWYLGALRACEEMARHLGDADFADTCRRLFQSGRRYLDTHLFNGRYYEHEIRPPRDPSAIAPSLRIGMGAGNLQEPELQLGAGCLVDQLVGQFMAHVCGLGYLVEPAHVRTALGSIMKYNFRKDFYGHFNHLRTFVLNEESALVMASYPLGRRPKRPFPYYNEVMTGFEYTAAVGMLYERMTAAGLKCIRAVRARYDGAKRNPFNEAECGHHYARAMASWAAVPALTGFRYSGVTKTMEFAPARGRKPLTWFWSNGYAWGTVCQTPRAGSIGVELRVLGGEVGLAAFRLTGAGAKTWANLLRLRAGGRARWRMR